MINNQDNRYTIEGHFYTKEISGNEENLRSVLEIKRSNVKTLTPNFMAIMMNPGSSKPIDENKIQKNWNNKNKKILTCAKPDKTQYQLMKLMDLYELNYIKVLNLSDIRTPKSNDFYSKLSKYSTDDNHSIFGLNRSGELILELGNEDIPIIAGWGLSHNLIRLADLASAAISGRTIIGIKDDEYNLYRHPLPPNHRKQVEWLDKIMSDINKFETVLKKCA